MMDGKMNRAGVKLKFHRAAGKKSRTMSFSSRPVRRCIEKLPPQLHETPNRFTAMFKKILIALAFTPNDMKLSATISRKIIK